MKSYGRMHFLFSIHPPCCAILKALKMVLAVSLLGIMGTELGLFQMKTGFHVPREPYMYSERLRYHTWVYLYLPFFLSSHALYTCSH